MKLKVEITCGNCRRGFKQAVAEMRPGRSRGCPYCGSQIRFTGDDGAKAQRALDELEGAIKRFPKKIELRF